MAIIEYTGYYENWINHFNHTHTYCEIIYIVSGQVSVTDGKQSENLTANDCLLIKSCQPHDVRPVHGIDYKHFVAFINPWELKKQLVCPDLFAMLTDTSESGFIHLQNVPKLYYGFEKMIDIFENGGNIYTELSAALNVISEIYEKIMPRQTCIAEHSAKRLTNKVRTYIEQNYADNIKIAQIALDNFVSVGYLTHSFKSETGMSPRKYLSHIRCTRAYEMICNTNMTFKEIAANTGFCCANDMSQKIRGHYGKTPTELRFIHQTAVRE